MYDKEVVKKIVDRLYEFQGADFKDQRVQFRFATEVRLVIMDLIHQHNLFVAPADLLGQRIAFSGVTFEDDPEYPTMCYSRY